MKVQNLQRGTAGSRDRAADANSPQYGKMGGAGQDSRRKLQAKKRATELLRGPIGMKVKNLQRGTADAVELGGKPPCASTECDMVVFCAVNNA